MTTATLIIAHAPLASALRQCVLHVFPAAEADVAALDVMPDATPEDTLEQAKRLLGELGAPQTLLFTDVFGATPCNIAQKLVTGQGEPASADVKLIAGVNLPMLLRTISYRHEPLELLAARAMAGGQQGVMQVAVTPPQNQAKRKNDQEHRDHQQ
jgi:PTS system ascorbate-specific IIA component